MNLFYAILKLWIWAVEKGNLRSGVCFVVGSRQEVGGCMHADGMAQSGSQLFSSSAAQKVHMIHHSMHFLSTSACDVLLSESVGLSHLSMET